MANKNQEEQNAIEKLNENLTSTSQKIAENKKVIFMVLGGIAVVAAAVLIYFFAYRNPRNNKAFEQYNQVEINSRGNDSIATAEYIKVAENYSGTDAGSFAALSAAENLYDAGKYQEALKYLDKFSCSEPVLKANVTALKGDCYVNLKKYGEAIDCFKKAISQADKNPQIVPRVLFKMANVYDAQKKYQDALDCYEQIKAEYPTVQIGGNMGVEAYIDREKARLGK